MTVHFHSTREAGVTLERRDALARPASFDSEARSIEAIIATDQPVKRRDLNGEYFEVLDIEGAEVDSLRGASVLNSHNQHDVSAVIGVVDDVWREANTLVARLRFSDRTEVASVVDDIAAGILRSLSVGYEITETRESTDGGMRTLTATRWRPAEVSFVPVPADPRARTRARPLLPGRARSIRSLATQAGIAPEVIDDYIDRGLTLDQVRGAVFDDMLTRSAVPIRTAARESLDNPEFRVRAMSEALYARVNPKFTPSGPARQFLGMSISDVAKECLRRSGVPTTDMSAAAIITRAGQGLHSTADFPAVMLDVINKTLRPAYQAAPSGLKQLAKEKTAPDFRTQYRVQLDSLSFQLLHVPETGEFKYDTMADTGELLA
jgi:phage head maturation protease